MDGKDGGVAAQDEGEGAEAGNSVGHSDGELPVQVLGAPQRVVGRVRRHAAIRFTSETSNRRNKLEVESTSFMFILLRLANIIKLERQNRPETQ